MSENNKIEKAIRNSEASLRMEGLKSSPELEDARRMVLEGKMSDKEYIEMVLRYAAKKEKIKCHTALIRYKKTVIPALPC